MPQVGVYGKAEADAAIAAHAALATVHQDAPALINTHKGDASAHHARYTDAEADARADAKVATHAGLFTGIHGITVVRKTADETVNNNETLQNDDDLVIAVGANEVWLIHMVIYSLRITGDPDGKFAFAVPAGGAMVGWEAWSKPTSQLVQKDYTAENLITIAPNNTYRAWMHGMYIGGVNAGNLQFQWAQETATAEDTKILAKSFMLCQRLA